MIGEKQVKLGLVKKINQSGAETEACEECAASVVCKLKDQLHKAKVEKYEAFVKECDFLIEADYQG